MKRADWQNRLQAAASRENRNPLSRFALRRAARVIGGYNIQAADAARRAAVGEEVNKQSATGRDDEIRGLTVDRAAANEGDMETGARSDGHTYSTNGLRRIHSNGSLQYKTLGGGWVNEGAVIEGHRRWGRDHYAQQAALSYEMRKALAEDDCEDLGTRYNQLAEGVWGMTDTEALGAWNGASYENQNQHLEYKYTNSTNGQMDTQDRRRGFVDEVYEKKGSYPVAQMHGSTIKALQTAYVLAGEEGDIDQQQKIAAIAETFMHEISATGDPKTPEGAGAPTGQRMTSTPGAAHVAERVRELAEMTGVFHTAPTGEHANPDNNIPPPAPPRNPTRREQ